MYFDAAAYICTPAAWSGSNFSFVYYSAFATQGDAGTSAWPHSSRQCGLQLAQFMCQAARIGIGALCAEVCAALFKCGAQTGQQIGVVW
jgi:hypothetical protein